MEVYLIENGIMKQNLKDYEFRQAVKYALWWAIGALSAHVLHGFTAAPWTGMGLIAVIILTICLFYLKEEH